MHGRGASAHGGTSTAGKPRDLQDAVKAIGGASNAMKRTTMDDARSSKRPKRTPARVQRVGRGNEALNGSRGPQRLRLQGLLAAAAAGRNSRRPQSARVISSFFLSNCKERTKERIIAQPRAGPRAGTARVLTPAWTGAVVPRSFFRKKDRRAGPSACVHTPARCWLCPRPRLWH